MDTEDTPKKKKKKNVDLTIDKERAKLEKFDPRGVQTLFRTLSRNHYNLLRMIDNKSSIILTINSILISLFMGILYLAPIAQKELILFGFRVIMIFIMLSMIFALLSMLPHRYIGKMFRDSGYKGTLYAGNFSKFSLEEFQEEFARILRNGHSVYDEMIKDLYFLGKSIALKQKLLHISFVLFMTGLLFMIIYIAVYGGGAMPS